MNKKQLLIVVAFGLGWYLVQAKRPTITQGGNVPLISDLYTSITDVGNESQPVEKGTSIIDDIAEAGEFIMSRLTGTSGVAAMRNVNRALVNHPQIRAFLAVIRKGEGTADAGGYSRLFGGGTFDSYAWHPGIVVKKSGYSSSAAGAYQFIKPTWDETAGAMGLKDFSPVSQDIGAIGRLAFRGAIDDILAGRFLDAIKKTGKEWASLPYSPYGQPVISYQTALNTFKNNGGSIGVMV